jgi:hypothetical protein
MEPKNIFSEYIKKGEIVTGNSQKTFVRFSCINENSIEKSPKKSRNLLKLPEISHQRSGSDISEYTVIDENNEIKNENLKTDLLMDKIISNDEQKQTLSDIIIGGESKEEDNKEKNKEKNKEIKNDKSEEKKEIINSNEKENIEELKKVSDIIESEEIKKKDNNEKEKDKDKEIKSEESKELNDVKEKEKEKEKIEKSEKIDSVENKNIIEKTVSNQNQNLLNNNYLESDKNVSDIEILIALFIVMIIGCLLVY